jgi:fatty acid desaturase
VTFHPQNIRIKIMLKFIPGILILQAVTIALVLIGPADPANWGWLRLAIPILIAGILTTFWFGSIAARQRKDEISRLREDLAKERETIRVNAERAKTKMVKQTQRKTLQEVRRSSRRANVKIGLAFAGAAGLGGLLVMTQFMSLGLLTLAFVGGATGGYILRIRQEKGKPQLPPPDQDPASMINATPSNKKQHPRIDPP